MHNDLYNSIYSICNSEEQWCNEDYEVQHSVVTKKEFGRNWPSHIPYARYMPLNQQGHTVVSIYLHTEEEGTALLKNIWHIREQSLWQEWLHLHIILQKYKILPMPVNRNFHKKKNVCNGNLLLLFGYSQCMISLKLFVSGKKRQIHIVSTDK